MNRKPIDLDYVNEELHKFFNEVTDSKKIKGDRLLKYRERFYRERNKIIRYNGKRRTERLSLGKKLEILCTYAGFRLEKHTHPNMPSDFQKDRH